MYFASPISLFLLQRWPWTCRFSILIGLVIACIGIITSSFATQDWQLIITQGIVYAVGACMLYYPILVFIDEWFVRRKGLAFGVCWVSVQFYNSLNVDSSHSFLCRLEAELGVWRTHF